MKRILIVGPCYADAQSLKKALLSKFALETIEVTKSDEAKTVLRQRKIDAVFINRILVGDKSSGLDFLTHLKKSSPSIPIIFLTRFPESQEAALKSGASAAFDIDLLIGYIRPSMEEKQKKALEKLAQLLS